MQRVTYYALRPVQVGDDVRQPGDLVPEAAGWPFLSGYIQDGKLAPVLVVTLPEAVQTMLQEWEDAQNAPAADTPVAKEKTPATPAKGSKKEVA